MKVWVYHNYFNNNKTKKAILQELKNKYPNSKYTKSAINLIQDKPYEKYISTSQKVKLLFLESQKQYFDENKIEKAFTYLDSIINNFSESSYYPKALYFKSHLLLTEYTDTARAKPLLQELLKDYSGLEFTNKIPSYFNNNEYIIPEEKDEKSEIQDSLKTSVIDSLKNDSTLTDTLEIQTETELQDTTENIIDSLHQNQEFKDTLSREKPPSIKKP